jgi:hypothetical protein
MGEKMATFWGIHPYKMAVFFRHSNSPLSHFESYCSVLTVVLPPMVLKRAASVPMKSTWTPAYRFPSADEKRGGRERDGEERLGNGESGRGDCPNFGQSTK